MSTHTTEQWTELCQQVKATLPKQLGKEAWYLAIAAALSASPDTTLFAEFYGHLVQHDESFQTDEAIARLSQRFNDVLLKETVAVGAPRVLMLLTAWAKVQGSPERKAEGSVLSNKWKDINPSKIYDRGSQTINNVYGKNLLQDKVFPSYGEHTRDIQFMELFTVYGLYLSDFELLTPLETETVVLTTIMCLGFTGPTLWHFRGMGRLLGASGTDETSQKMEEIKNHIRGIKLAATSVVEFVGEEFERNSKIENWPNVGDVKRDLGGWGEDSTSS